MDSVFSRSSQETGRGGPKPRRSRLCPFVVAGIALLLSTQVVRAGANQGGTLVVHDTGLSYSGDIFTYPTVPPADCSAIDAAAPGGLPADGAGWVWKVYAAFPEGSHPRLKALAFGADWDPSEVQIVDGGVPDPYWDFEVRDDHWLSRPGAGVGVSLYTVRSSPVSEVYWIAGYAEGSGLWSVTPHPRQPAIFVDGSVPSAEDEIEGFSSIGLGTAGRTVCPIALGACCLPDGTCGVRSKADCEAAGGLSWGRFLECEPYPCTSAPGACCLPDGSCRLTSAIDCTALGGTPLARWTSCLTDPCPPPLGACCYVSGYCGIRDRDVCAQQDGSFQGPETVCTPNPCLQPIHGGCCLPSGQCVVLSPGQCAQIAGNYLGDDSVCIPNPCPQPDSPGACCLADGACRLRTAEDCAGIGGTFVGVGSDCDPNRCVQPEGACCLPEGRCEILVSVECRSRTGAWLGAGTSCEPALCDSVPGSCCLADGSCRLIPVLECAGVFLPGVACEADPCRDALGACCFLDGSCLMLLEGHCLANGGFYWWHATTCEPNPCDATLRQVRKNWGWIKNRFRD